MKESDNSSSIFSTLMQLPLLRGASQSKLSEVVGRMKLHFFKAEEGTTVVEHGQACTSLVFVMSGSVRLTMQSGDGSFMVAQTLDAPRILSPDCLFGYDTVYPCSVTVLTAASFMEISKEDFRRMLAMDSVFLFNYLNAICTGSQRGGHGLMSIAGGSASERLAYWITTLTQQGARDIVITSTGREIHNVLGISASGMRSAVERLAPHAVMPDAHTLKLTTRD